jgi:hypothetical protein
MPALPPASSAPAAASASSRRSWSAFERNLAAALAAFDREFLVLDVKGTSAYVQVHASGRRFRCETVSNRWLPPEERLDEARTSALLALGWSPPVDDAAGPGASPPRGSPNFFRDFGAPARPSEVARLVVRTLVEVHRVPGPDRLEYTSFDGEGHDVLLPSLGISPRAAPATRATTAAPPRRARARPGRRTGAGTVLRRVLAELRRGTGDDSLHPDGDGEIGVWLARGLFALVSVLERPLAVRVSCLVADDVEPTSELLARLHELNATMALARLVLANGAVFCAIDVPASPFRVEHLREALRAVRVVAAEVRPRVHECAPAASA